MKKTFTYLLVIAFFISAVGFIVIRYNNSEDKKSTAFHDIKERRGPSAQTTEWVSTRKTAKELVEAAKKNPDDLKSRLALAALFVQEGRVTGDYLYYDAAAMKYVNDVLAKEPQNFEGLIYKAIIQLSQHHFSDGLSTAQQAQKTSPYNAFVYGIMVDANVELGNYSAAVENSDKMMSIRPDLRSYSRVAYLREIHGDIPGAMQAMKMAIEAGMPGQEGTEWCRVQLGQLYEHQGSLDTASMIYEASLQERPGYAYALAGIARVATATKDYNKAIDHYKQAYEMVSDYSFREKQVEVYQLAGMTKEATALGNEVINEMTAASKNSQYDDSAGHYSDRELAYAYLTVNNTTKALEHALQEYNRRPDNIDVNETLAWVYYNKGEYEKALPYMKAALKTNSKNPTLLCRAGLVHYKAGQSGEAGRLLQEAFSRNANMAGKLRTEGTNVLQTIQKG